MQLHQKTSIATSSRFIKIIIKIAISFTLFFLAAIMIDKIDFPSPEKKIEKNIPNENLKVVK